MSFSTFNIIFLTEMYRSFVALMLFIGNQTGSILGKITLYIHVYVCVCLIIGHNNVKPLLGYMGFLNNNQIDMAVL